MHFDNAKFLLMVLAVWHHVRDSAGVGCGCDLPGGSLLKSLWFHMPTFVMLPGAVWKPFTYGRIERLAITVVAPLAIFAALFPLVLMAATQAFDQPNTYKDLNVFSQPIHAGLLGSGPIQLWFLRGLIVWRVGAHALQWLPPWVQFVVTIILGMTAAIFGKQPHYQQGITDPQDLGPFAVVRAAQLLPFFMVGRHAPHLMSRVPDFGWKGRVAAWCCFALAIIAYERGEVHAGWHHPHCLIQKIVARIESMETQPTPWTGMAWMATHRNDCRSDLYFLAFRYLTNVMFRLAEALSFMNFCVPRDHTWFTTAGGRTMYPFLLHGVGVVLVVFATVDITGGPGGFRVAPSMPAFTVCAWLVASIFIVWLLTTGTAVRLAAGLVEPHWIVGLATFIQAKTSPARSPRHTEDHPIEMTQPTHNDDP